MLEFQIGDRVIISQLWFDKEVAGRIGTVAEPDESITLHDGCYWIELDVEEWIPGITEAAEVNGQELQRV